MRTLQIILIAAVFTAFAGSGCQKQEGRNQQTPDSAPTTTSPMNPR